MNGRSGRDDEACSTGGSADEGDAPPPNYEELQDYTEAICVEFDPTVVSYRQLVEEWTKLHTPTDDQSLSTRYKSVIWYLNPKQQQIAEEVIESWKKATITMKQQTVHTNLLPVTRFYMAETYHQDYYLRTGQARWIS